MGATWRVRNPAGWPAEVAEVDTTCGPEPVLAEAPNPGAGRPGALARGDEADVSKSDAWEAWQIGAV
ncbi:hypothetical protein FHT00_002845 [Sphingomonas insulae]|nr:hypothetical protein [Sphingomonas insulae]